MLRRPVLLALALTACNQAPDIGALAIGPSAPSTLDDLVLVVPQATDADRSDEPTVHIQWTVNGVDVPPLDDRTKVPASFTEAGDIWSAKVIASDGIAESVPRIVSTQIANTRPSGTVRVVPENPLPGEAFTAEATFADIDGDALETTWHWAVDGQRTDYNGPTIPAGESEKGETWTVSVVARDGEASGRAAQATIRIGNAPPAVHHVSVGPNPARTGDPLLTTVSAADPDGDPIDFRYTWLVDNQPVDVVGGTFPANLATRNQRVSVWVVATDGVSASTPVRGDVWISNTPPTLASAFINVVSPTVGDTLSCIPRDLEDADNDEVTVDTYWRVNGNEVANDLTLSRGFVSGDIVSCVLVPTDGQHNGSPVESDEVVIGNSLPAIDSIVLSGTIAPITATAVGAADADGDEVKVEWSWTVNGASVFEGATLPSGLAVSGDTIQVSAVPFDGIESGTAVLASVVLGNAEPIVSAAQLSGDARTDGELIVHVESTDPEGDVLHTAYQWTVNDAVVDAQTATLPGSYFDRGDTVVASVLVTDGPNAVLRTSGAVVIGNTPPTLASATIQADGAVAGDVLSVAYPQAEDADGDEVTTTYRWTVDGVAFGASSTFEVPELPNGAQIRAHVYPSDGIDTGYPTTSNSVTAHNGSPEVTEVTLAPDQDVSASTVLLASWQATDPESDPLQAQYVWFVNDVAIANAGPTMPVWTIAERGDEVHVEVLVSDGGTTSEPYASQAVAVGNSAPETPELVFEPEVPTPGQPLVCGISSDTVDGDAIAYTFLWSADGESYQGPTQTAVHTDDAIPADQVGLFAEWSCSVVAADHLDSSAMTSQSADVGHEDGVSGVYATSDYALYRLDRITLPDTDAQQAYAQACVDVGLQPVSCEWSSLGDDYDASAYDALDLDSTAFDCDVSAAVAQVTGWNQLISFHQPAIDPRGVCAEGCAQTQGTVSPLCGESL